MTVQEYIMLYVIHGANRAVKHLSSSIRSSMQQQIYGAITYL